MSSLFKGSKDGESLQTHLRSLFWPYYERPEEFIDLTVLQSDVTHIVKRYSEKLAEGMYVAIPNHPISTNKPLDVGYEFSHINLCTGQYKRHPQTHQPYEVFERSTQTSGLLHLAKMKI